MFISVKEMLNFRIEQLSLLGSKVQVFFNLRESDDVPSGFIIYCQKISSGNIIKKYNVPSELIKECHNINIKEDLETYINRVYSDLMYVMKNNDNDNDKSSLRGIWDSSYVQMLGIQDHCKEIVDLYSAWKVEKAKQGSGYGSDLESQLEKEIMDLYIILQKWAENKDGLYQKRLNGFMEKAKNDNR
jgi:hypothetical protein